MPRYFTEFPLLTYQFGDAEAPVLFKNMSKYVQIQDTVVDDVTAYDTYYIKDYTRADHASVELYGTPDYYWTFYYVNDSILTQGWPIADTELLDFAKDKYPHQALTTRKNIQNTFLQGARVTGSLNGAQGTVVSRDLNNGQIIVQPDDQLFDPNETQLVDNTTTESINLVQIDNVEDQYLAAHHYENDDGEYVDIITDYVGTYPTETAVFSVVGLNKITHFERLQKQNQELKSIRVFRPEVIDQIVGEYRRLIGS